jgi:hypothetical protein
MIRTASWTFARHAGYWLRDDQGQLTAEDAAHLLGWLHVPECDHDAARARGGTS